MSRSGRVAIGLLALFAVAALLAPLWGARGAAGIGDVLGARLLPPGSRDASGGFHLLGTDRLGRDLVARTLLAGRVSLLVGLAGALMASAIGVAIGAIAGWRGGWMDRALMAVADALLAIPRLVLLLLCAALWGPGLTMVVLVLGATGWMGVARLTRAEVIAARGRPWAEAARAIGAGDRRTLWRHVLPNAIGPAIVATALGVGSAIMLESGLSFLGLGIQPPAASWGNMIAAGRDVIVTAPWVGLVPGIALVATTAAATILGDALRDRLAGERPVQRTSSVETERAPTMT
ncbi:MAG TPA: ABC transporter permease [Gemmatimonadaceae bacterium]|nr:ABC transporter permease [Gemmatimonadaceae bacterium]